MHTRAGVQAPTATADDGTGPLYMEAILQESACKLVVSLVVRNGNGPLIAVFATFAGCSGQTVVHS